MSENFFSFLKAWKQELNRIGLTARTVKSEQTLFGATNCFSADTNFGSPLLLTYTILDTWSYQRILLESRILFV